MKEVVIALLTTTINRYSEFPEALIRSKTTVRDLSNILDYVSDLEEDTSGPITVILNSNNEEVEILRKRIRELEDSCENMAQVEKNLNAKIKLYDVENQRLLSLCRQYNAKGIR